ncbi:MAG TPA: outer membrane beta-barrel protein [Longimicrobiales bacterium]
MRSIVKTLAALAAAVLIAAPVSGQVTIVPKVGFYSPANDLQAAQDALGEVVDDRGGSLALGAALEFGVPMTSLGVRVGFDYVTGSEFTYEDEASVEATAEQTMLAITGDVVLRPIPRLIIVQPYLLAGAGVKRYDFSFEEDAGTDVETAFPESETDFTVHAGIGVDLGLGPIALIAEVSDYISWYETGEDESEMQNDLFLMAGVRLGLF